MSQYNDAIEEKLNGSRYTLALVVRAIFAGIFVGYGFISFFCFIYLEIKWASQAPHSPIPIEGLIYRHNQHGDYTYFNRFQATTCALMFWTSIPLAFVGFGLAPKKYARGESRWSGNRYNPDRLMTIVMWTSGAITPLLLYLFGPFLIENLNTAGFIVDLG